MYLIIEKLVGIQTIEACPNKNPFCANDSKSMLKFFIF